MIQITCPKCNATLTLPSKYIFDCGCTYCDTQIRIRNGKTFEESSIVNNLLYSITILFAAIAREDSENKNIYFEFFNNFVNLQSLTKSQFNDINKIFKNEYKNFFHQSYKKIITELKKATDEAFKTVNFMEQQACEDNIYSWLYQLAICTGNINLEQQKVLNTFTSIFEFSDIRKKVISEKLTPEKPKKINPNAEEAFNKIANALIQIYPTQEEFIKNLIVSFKRPFISETSKSYKNFSAILSTEDDLIQDIINQITIKMKEEVLIFGNNICIDCANFSENTDYDNFLHTLSECTNSSNDIIILKNFKALSTDGISMVSQILYNGKVKSENEDSTITIKDKFFIILTASNQDELLKLLGEKSFTSLADLIKLEELSPEDITRFTENILNNFVLNTRQNLQLNLYYDPIIINTLTQIYNKNTGMKSIFIYIDYNIQKPLVEYKLKRQPSPDSQLVITLVDNKLALSSEGQTILLEKLLPKIHNANLDDIKAKLDKIIGLDSVKQYVLKLEDNVTAQKLRKESGFKSSTVSMNMIFTGNPGTGKTTIARIVAEYLAALGVISKGQLVEVSRNDLVGEYQGSTAQKTAEKIKAALGGVLFIDEAYALCRDSNDSFGLEAIDTLVKMMEDNKENLVVILAGYSNEMKEFLRNNSGLKSRFPNIIDFPDYTPTEMYRIAVEMARANDYVIDSQCIEPLMNYFEVKNVRGKNDSGNGRLVRNTVEMAVVNHSNRIIHETDGDFQTLKLVDFELKEREEFNLEECFDDIVGLDEVKNYIRALAAKIKINREREKLGIQSNTTQTLHMIFKGNPGTGKTMMARTVANLLYNLNVISTNNIVETDRAGLVAGYIGQTAQKTTDKVFEAMNGVLFIDEAYTLSQGGENDFGHEAIDTLVKLMDDNRDRLVVILAGYSENMQQFLDVNPGLQSRFPNIVEFSDYNLEQLMQITQNMFSKNGYELSDEAVIKLRAILDEVRVDPRFGNGRYVRNIFERATTNQALRINSVSDLTKEILTTIIPEDIEKL